MITKKTRTAAAIGLAAVLVFSLAACGTQEGSVSESEEETETLSGPLSYEEAQELAFEEGKTDAEDAEDVNIIYDETALTYTVIYTEDSMQYTFVIDAETGEILSSDKAEAEEEETEEE